MASATQRILSCYWPHIEHVAEKVRFVPHFERLLVVWNAGHPSSEGVEQFVDRFLPVIRKNNPHVEYRLDRGYVNSDPFIVGTFKWNRERSERLRYRHPQQILAVVEQWSIGGDYRIGRLRKVATIIPRGQQIWDTENKGHDVFKVYSKWKGDPPDPDAMTVQKHPNYLFRYINANRK